MRSTSVGLSRSPRNFVVKSGGTIEGGRDPARVELPLGLSPRHRNEIDFGRPGEPLRDVEPRLADDEQAGERAVLVDERDPRPLARIANDEADDQRDHQGVGDERESQGRHAPQRANVLAEQQRDPPHAASSR